MIQLDSEVEKLQRKINEDRLWIVGVVLLFSLAQFVPFDQVRYFLSLVATIYGIIIWLDYRDSTGQYKEYHKAKVFAYRQANRLPLPAWESANIFPDITTPDAELEPEPTAEPTSAPIPDNLVASAQNPKSVIVAESVKASREFIVYLYTQGTDADRKILRGEDDLETNTEFKNAGEMLRELSRSGWITGRDGKRKIPGWLVGTKEQCLRAHNYLT